MTKLERIAVTIPPDDSNVLFTHVEEDLNFPMPQRRRDRPYVVYIGFDPVGAQEIEQEARPKPQPRQARRPASR